MNNNIPLKLFSYLTYPVGVGFALILHAMMLTWGINLQISTYVPILIVAVFITFLELYFPNLPQWHPDKREVKNDVIYMIFVQTLLPKVLGFIAALFLLRHAQSNELTISMYWPHQMPVWVQVIVMLLVSFCMP